MRLAQWLTIVTLLSLGGIVSAQEAAEDPREAEAREHFDIGRRLYDLGSSARRPPRSSARTSGARDRSS